MTVTQALIGFAAVAALLTVVPGIDTTLVLRSTLVRGRRHGLATALGVCLGVFVWGAAAAVGAAALLATSQVAFRVVTLAGALYMVVLGVRMVIAGIRGRASHEPVAAQAPPSSWRALLVGLTTNVLNPKIGVFYVATIPQFIPDGAPALGMGLSLAGVHAVLGVVWFALIIGGAGAARRQLSSPLGVRVVDAVAGSVLVALGARLAFAHR